MNTDYFKSEEELQRIYHNILQKDGIKMKNDERKTYIIGLNGEEPVIVMGINAFCALTTFADHTDGKDKLRDKALLAQENISDAIEMYYKLCNDEIRLFIEVDPAMVVVNEIYVVNE